MNQCVFLLLNKFGKYRAGMTRTETHVLYVGQSPSASSITAITYSYKSEGALVRLPHGWKEFILNPYRERAWERKMTWPIL